MSYKYSPPPAMAPATSRSDIEQEFWRWNQQAGSQVVTDWDLPMMKTGQLTAEVMFLLRGRRVPVKVAKWDSFAVNLRCAYLVIREMRLAEARGVSEAMAGAFAALPAPQTERDPWEVLGLRPGVGAAQIEAAYKTLAKEKHPDAGGSPEAFKELDEAYKRAKAEVRA